MSRNELEKLLTLERRNTIIRAQIIAAHVRNDVAGSAAAHGAQLVIDKLESYLSTLPEPQP